MNFVTFIENRFQELNLEGSDPLKYDVMKDCETKALHQVLGYYRSALKFALIPKCLFDYIQVELQMKDAPEPVLMNKLKAEKKAQEERIAASAPDNVTCINMTDGPKIS